MTPQSGFLPWVEVYLISIILCRNKIEVLGAIMLRTYFQGKLPEARGEGPLSINLVVLESELSWLVFWVFIDVVTVDKK